MTSKRLAFVSLLLSAAIVTDAVAQTAAEPAPSGGAVPLPSVEVVGKKQAAKRKVAAKKQTATAPKKAPAPTPVAQDEPAPEQAGRAGAAETSTSPVENYVANVSAVGTKTDTPLRQTPQSISVIGKEQMRDQGVQNFQEAFRYTPGVLADAFGYDTRTDSVNVRGLPAAVFLDGLRASYGFFPLTIEPYTLERAEVLRGPASMLYGQTTTGGILNAVSKRPQPIPYREITVEYGSYDFKQTKIDFTGPLTQDGRWLYRVTGLARDADTQVDFVENNRLMIQPSLTFRPQRDTSITLMGSYRKDDGGITQQFFPNVGTLTPNAQGKKLPIEAFAGEPGDFYDTAAWSVSGFVDHKFTPDLKLHHATRYALTNSEYVSHLPAVMTPYRAFALGLPGYYNGYANPEETSVIRLLTDQETETRIFNSDTNLTASFETLGLRHKVTGGFDFTRFASSSSRIGAFLTNTGFPNDYFDVYDPHYGEDLFYFDFQNGGFTTDPQRSPDPTQVQMQKGLYLQDQLQLGNWIAVLGVRQDWLDINQQGRDDVKDTATTLRGGLMYEFGFGLTPYASYSESFTPQPGTLVLAKNSLENFTSPGAPELRAATPLEGEQIELGFKFQPVGANWFVNASIYRLEERNQVKSPDTIVRDIQGADVKIRGFEIEGVGQVTSELKLIAGYSYTNAEYTKFPEPFELKDGTPVENVPKHQASFWGIYSWQDGFLRGLSVGGGVRYLGENTDTSPDLLSVVFQAPELQSITVPSYTLFDAMIAYETPDWRWNLNAVNLEDEYVVSACSVLRGDCFIGQGRTITTGFTYKF